MEWLGRGFFFKETGSIESALQALLQAKEEELAKTQAEITGEPAATDQTPEHLQKARLDEPALCSAVHRAAAKPAVQGRKLLQA